MHSNGNVTQKRNAACCSRDSDTARKRPCRALQRAARAPHGHQALVKPLRLWRIQFPPNIYGRRKSARVESGGPDYFLNGVCRRERRTGFRPPIRRFNGYKRLMYVANPLPSVQRYTRGGVFCGSHRNSTDCVGSTILPMHAGRARQDS
eukprot:1194713-Prorocentrum_minimum.AAC.1